jgi:N-acylneuraminate cytidylyltransferase
MSDQIIAVIPVREKSKGIPHKNVKELCGKPLLFWVIDALNSSNVFDQIWVATDCAQTEDLIKNTYSSVRVFNRSPDNATDASPSIDVILEFLQKLQVSENTILLMAQATSPFTSETEFYNGVKMIRDNGYDSVVPCVRLKKFLWDQSGRPLNYDLRYKPRRQDFDGLMVESGSYYASRVSCILKTKQLLSGKIGVLEVSQHNQIEIDEPVDWYLAEAQMLYLKNGRHE